MLVIQIWTGNLETYWQISIAGATVNNQRLDETLKGNLNEKPTSEKHPEIPHNHNQQPQT